MFAIWTEHTKPNSGFDCMISSEVGEIKAGSWLISCDEAPTHWYLHSIFDSFEEAYSAQQNLLNNTEVK
jgi:hypothetical protein